VNIFFFSVTRTHTIKKQRNATRYHVVLEHPTTVSFLALERFEGAPTRVVACSDVNRRSNHHPSCKTEMPPCWRSLAHTCEGNNNSIATVLATASLPKHPRTILLNANTSYGHATLNCAPCILSNNVPRTFLSVRDGAFGPGI